MIKHSVSTILLVALCLTGFEIADADEKHPVLSSVPEVFRAFDDNSDFTIDYDVLTELLNAVVLDVGRSDRQFAAPAQDITGTRMKARITKTENEGNRFFYESFMDNEAGRQFLVDIRKSLEHLPTERPLAQFSREEQLAYWLNLYNVTVLSEVISVYPKRNLKKVLTGDDSIFARKLLNVAGVPLSLNDIQFTILRLNYDSNPLILYGLYQGIVGGPNIRTSAFYGADVYNALEKNAFEFVNSNRGTRDSVTEGSFLVSSFYERNQAYFPDFEADLSAHLLQYLIGDERAKLQAANDVRPDIDDWTITDMGGTRHEVGGSLAHNNAALMDAFRSNHKSVFGGVLTATLEVQWKRDKPKEEIVTIEDIDDSPIEGARMEVITEN